MLSGHDYGFVVVFPIRIIAPVSFGVYILISLLRKKVTSKTRVPVTNCHTNPPSTRVSLPTDTAEHTPNFLSASTAEPSAEYLLMIKLNLTAVKKTDVTLGICIQHAQYNETNNNYYTSK